MKLNLLLPVGRHRFSLFEGKTILILLLYFVSTGAIHAQQNTAERKISGTIVDETGSAMPGVSILISGTSTGTRSDADGKYELIVPADRDVLHVTFIGYKNVDITVGSQTIINVTM